ncbi:MAG: tyrosine--tRNA ligase [Candidatus Micrarchaeota archaeon]
MDIGTKIELFKKGSVVEVLTEGELKALFEKEKHPKHYIGFEISGLVHLGTGLATAIKIKDFMKAGIKPTIFLADYHAWINGKMGGDLEKIQKVAKGYFKHCFHSLGLEEGPVKFVMGSDLYEKIGRDYWADVMRVANNTTKERMLRCTTIMGRKETDAALPTSVMMYPAMQVADIWALDVDIAHAGMDQRKVHVLARELAEKMKRKKPVTVHGALLSGLRGGAKRMDVEVRERKIERAVPGTGGRLRVESSRRQVSVRELNEDEKMIENKMSKSNPNSCIFIHDSEGEIKKKMKNAYCPPKIVDGNPVIEMAEMFVLRDKPLLVERDAKFGGDVEFENIAELNSAFMSGKLHPMDLKNSVAKELIEILEPSRKYFEKHKKLIDEVKG